jgi:hypothetical protein
MSQAREPDDVVGVGGSNPLVPIWEKTALEKGFGKVYATLLAPFPFVLLTMQLPTLGLESRSCDTLTHSTLLSINN